MRLRWRPRRRCRSGLAGNCAVATLSEARRKGIGGAMAVAPLLEARNMGYRLGIRQASAAGHSAYRNIGL
ncbi:MAG: hypothetical protein P8164_00495 [Gammaproteobacteria bacterium]